MLLSNVVTLATCVMCLGYFVLACWAFPQARKLLNGTLDFNTDGEVSLPLIFCEFDAIESIYFDEFDIESGGSIDLASHPGCTTLHFLINAAAASLVVSATAVVVHLFETGCNFRSKMLRHRSFTKILFLIFILIQSAISSWALAAEVKQLDGFMEDALEYCGFFDDYGYTGVRTHGDDKWLWISGSADQRQF